MVVTIQVGTPLTPLTMHVLADQSRVQKPLELVDPSTSQDFTCSVGIV
jgi:hypothetical protein